MTISQRIFEELKKQRKKQKDLAAYIGISTSAVSDWKKKGTNPSAEYISVIADFLEVSTDFLLTGMERSNNARISNSTVGAVGSYSNGTITMNNSLNTKETQSESNSNPKQNMSDNSKELLVIFESFPMREQVRLLNAVYDFQEQYNKNGTISVPNLTGSSAPNSLAISQNEQKLLDVFKNFNDYEQVKIIGRIEDWLDAKLKREAANQQRTDNVSGVPQPEESPTIQQSKPWRLTARRTDGVYESRMATPEEVAKLKELLENNPEEPEY